MGMLSGDLSGISVSLSQDGNTLVVGAIYNGGAGEDAGQAKVFVFDGWHWMQRGLDINGLSALDYAGHSVSISADGSVVVIGSQGYGTENQGQARVFSWDGESWVIKGAAVEGSLENERFGYRVALSADSNVLAISGYSNAENPERVKIFEWNGDSWSRRGGKLPGILSDVSRSWSVSLSEQGDFLALGSVYSSEDGRNGLTKVFHWSGEVWNAVGQEIFDERFGDRSGFSIDLSNDGNILAVGAYLNDGRGRNSGHVRIFQMSSLDLFPLDPLESSDVDADGVGDNADLFDDNPFEAFDNDLDGIGDNSDPDDDNDTFTDADEVAAGTDPLSASSCPGCFSFDVDDDGEAKALTDGLLVIRHLFGFSGEALTAGALGSNAKRTTSEDIGAYLGSATTELDIDGDEEAKALTDGLLLIRQLFGFTGNALISGAVGETAERGTASLIQSYIAQRLPEAIGSGTGSSNDDSIGTGGNGDAGGVDGGLADSKTIEINVVYDRVPYCKPDTCGFVGLDYANTVQKPVRFAKAVVLDADSDEIVADNLRTDAAGNLSFSVSANTAFIVQVYAESTGDGAASWGLRIVDNEGRDQAGDYRIYVLRSQAVNAETVDAPLTLSAESGWGLTNYTQTRSAAPFAILDSMISATLYALQGRSALSFEPIDVYWSEANTLDNVGTSYFSGTYIMILGDAGVDTDEYDESVIIHEWGHYLQTILSRDDSIGGPHGSGDLLDMRVAFSEGWANAYSGLASNRDVYSDTSGRNQGDGFTLSLESELTVNEGAVKGWYSEDSIQYIVFDLFDQGESDDDTLALPVSAMIASMVDFMPKQAAATSIFGFGAGVIAADISQTRAIMALFNREDIGSGLTTLSASGVGETNSAQDYTDVTGVSDYTLPIFTILDSSLISQEICQTAATNNNQRTFGVDNKLGAYRFVQFEISTAGDYNVALTTTATPPDAAGDPDFGIYNASGLIGPDPEALTFDANSESHTLRLAKGLYWAWLHDFNNYEPGSQSGRYCHRLEVVPQ